MTIEERLKMTLGEAQFTIAVLATQLEEAQKKLAMYEASFAKKGKAKSPQPAGLGPLRPGPVPAGSPMPPKAPQ